MLVVAGACDGVSVVVRRAITRLFAPDAMRGRVAIDARADLTTVRLVLPLA